MKTEILLGGFFCLTAAVLPATWAANTGAPGSGSKNPAVTLQPIPGSPAKRVILTQKASERLGIETGRVSEQAVVRKQMVGGVIVPPLEKDDSAKPGSAKPADVAQTTPAGKSGSTQSAVPSSKGPVVPMAGGGFAGFGGGSPAPQATLANAAPSMPRATEKDTPPVAAPARAPVPQEAWLLVTLSPAEWERLAKDKPARILPLATRDKSAHEILAKPSKIQPEEDSRRSMLKLYYIVSSKDHGLEFNKRMRVELQLTGSDETHKVVPYSAVYYDAKGAAWVYVNTQPLTYERQRVTVDRIEGDVAVLSGGPPLGTPVVVTGAPLLYGAEVFGK